MSYIEKYEKYKAKYLQLKKQQKGGAYQMFNSGDKVKNIFNSKTGVVESLRNDKHEQQQRRSNPNHYYYTINYDDGSFDTYVSQSSLQINTNYSVSQPTSSVSYNLTDTPTKSILKEPSTHFKTNPTTYTPTYSQPKQTQKIIEKHHYYVNDPLHLYNLPPYNKNNVNNPLYYLPRYEDVYIDPLNNYSQTKFLKDYDNILDEKPKRRKRKSSKKTSKRRSKRNSRKSSKKTSKRRSKRSSRKSSKKTSKRK